MLRVINQVTLKEFTLKLNFWTKFMIDLLFIVKMCGSKPHNSKLLKNAFGNRKISFSSSDFISYLH